MVLIYLSIDTKIKKLKQNGQITIDETNYVYLSLDGYHIGSEVNLELKYHSNFRYYILLYYHKIDTYNKTDFYNERMSVNECYYHSGTSHTHYYTIKLTKKTNYLLLIPSKFSVKIL